MSTLVFPEEEYGRLDSLDSSFQKSDDITDFVRYSNFMDNSDELSHESPPRNTLQSRVSPLTTDAVRLRRKKRRGRKKSKPSPVPYDRPQSKSISPSNTSKAVLQEKRKSPAESTSIAALQKEIEVLKKQLAAATSQQGSGTVDVVPKKNVVKFFKFDSLRKMDNYFPLDSSSDSIENVDGCNLETQSSHTENRPSLIELDNTPVRERNDEISAKTNMDDGLTIGASVQNSPSQKVELVEGYGIYITKRQLDEAVDQSCRSPTRLIRNLVMKFFPPHVLAGSSCFGNRKHPGLNKDVISACLKFTQQKFPEVQRSLLIDAINDKCANCRRKKK